MIQKIYFMSIIVGLSLFVTSCNIVGPIVAESAAETETDLDLNNRDDTILTTPTPTTPQSQEAELTYSPVQSDPTERPIILTGPDTGKTVVMPVGERLKLKLNEKLTIGYRWELMDVNEKILKLEREYYENEEGKAVSSSGQKVIVFKALRPGETNLKLSYAKPNEKTVPLPIAFDVLVVVK